MNEDFFFCIRVFEKAAPNLFSVLMNILNGIRQEANEKDENRFSTNSCEFDAKKVRFIEVAADSFSNLLGLTLFCKQKPLSHWSSIILRKERRKLSCLGFCYTEPSAVVSFCV